MTIAAAWVRTLCSGAEELIFCSDSRLSGHGARFDQGQKIFRLARTDAAICFAGGTNWAYPMIVAAINAADVHVPSKTRALGLPQFKNHLVNILDQMQREVHNYALDLNIPDVTFLLGGYDSWSKSFRIWRLEFCQAEGRFLATERTGSNAFGALGKIEIAGCDEWTREMRSRLKQLSQNRYGLSMKEPDGARFDLEPLEVIRDLVRVADADMTIGGAIQAVKVYQYLNSADVGILWPDVKNGRLFLNGRPLLSYEKASIKSILDPDSLHSTWVNGGPNDAVIALAKAVETADARASEDDIDASLLDC